MKVLKTLIVTGLVSLTALASPSVLAEDKLPSGTAYQDIGPKIEAFVKEHEDTTAGMETAVVTADETLYEGYFGYVNKEKKIKADENAVFEWGSTTKTLTWISVMQQVEAGKLDLKADIRTYLPKNFLKNLRFDKPVTLLDLMNHQGGFQETYTNATTADYDTITPLKDYLTQVQPPQVYEPGTITAYSNWSTSLAGYIVERVSGQDFADYVQAQIFKPLGMTQTAIRIDLSDNSFVKKQRARNLSYDSTGKALGPAISVVTTYPAGSVIGSLADLKTYAQALLRQEPGTIFQKKETWEEFFSASNTYGKSGIAKNQHGFWTSERAVTVTEHGGGTDGYTNGFLLDLKNKVGLVIMTNQSGEQVYNIELPELIFGDSKNSPYAKLDKGKPSGYYLPARRFDKGPFSISKILFYLMDSRSEIFRSMTSSKFYQTDQLADGTEVVRMTVSDLVAVTPGQVTLMRASLAAGIAAAVYALLHFCGSGLAWFYRKITRKSAPVRSQAWHHLVASSILITTAGVLCIIIGMGGESLQFFNYASYLAVGFALLALCLIGLLAWRLIYRPRGKQTWLDWTRLVLTTAAAGATLWFIYYWNLYQWWVA